MAKKLICKKNQQVICHKVTEANTLWTRTKGLLGTPSLATGECLWIKRCNSIHTWFMNYPLDLIFVDKNLNVVKTYKQVNPWKITLPNFKANSVFEMQSGWIKDNWPQKGDQLYVDA